MPAAHGPRIARRRGGSSGRTRMGVTCGGARGWEPQCSGGRWPAALDDSVQGGNPPRRSSLEGRDVVAHAPLALSSLSLAANPAGSGGSPAVGPTWSASVEVAAAKRARAQGRSPWQRAAVARACAPWRPLAGKAARGHGRRRQRRSGARAWCELGTVHGALQGRVPYPFCPGSQPGDSPCYSRGGATTTPQRRQAAD